MHEDIVNTRRDVVPIDPDVTARTVVPVAFDPDRSVVGRSRSLDDHCRRRWWRVGGGGGWLRLLDDDHRFSIDLLRAALRLLDHDVTGGIGLDRDLIAHVTVRAHDDRGVGGAFSHVAVRPSGGLRIGGNGDYGNDQRGHQGNKRS